MPRNRNLLNVPEPGPAASAKRRIRQGYTGGYAPTRRTQGAVWEPEPYLPLVVRKSRPTPPGYYLGQWPTQPGQAPPTIYTHPAQPRLGSPTPPSAGGLVYGDSPGMPGVNLPPSAGGLTYGPGTPALNVHGPDWIPTSEAMRSAGPYGPAGVYDPLSGTLSTAVHGPDWTFTPDGRLEFPYTTGQQPQVDTTGGGGGGGPTYAQAPEGVDAAWYKAFQEEHDGVTPEDWYQQTEGHNRNDALVEALADRQWGDEFKQMTGRAPSEYDWKNHYYSKYGGPREKGYRQERKAERRERRHGAEWEEERQQRRKEPETRPAMYVPPRTQRR